MSTTITTLDSFLIHSTSQTLKGKTSTAYERLKETSEDNVVSMKLRIG